MELIHRVLQSDFSRRGSREAQLVGPNSRQELPILSLQIVRHSIIKNIACYRSIPTTSNFPTTSHDKKKSGLFRLKQQLTQSIQ
jgi:hypothetical protein